MLATEKFMQSDAELLRRIAAITKQVIANDDILGGFLGLGGPESKRDALTGSKSLKE
jgi:hypothetical protein